MNEQFTFEIDENQVDLAQLEKAYRLDLNKTQTCPVCHEPQKKYIIVSDDFLGYAVQCASCGFVGPWSTDIQKSIAYFNKITCDHQRGF